MYVLSSLLVRGMAVFLTPLYTRAMGPSDFAVVAVANAIGAVATLVFGLCLSGCIPRLSFEYKGKDQRAFFGTLLLLSVAAPAVWIAVLYALGLHGHLEFFESLHFRPHLELVLWSSAFSVLMPLPLSVYNAREEAPKAALLGGSSALLQLGFTLLLVAWGHQGAVGVLRANLLSAAIVGAISIVLLARMSTLRLSLPGAKRALAFSLPLVPHLAANWALAISDRLILDRYVPAADVGRYALGYMFNVLLLVVASSIGSALAPMAYRQLKDPVAASNVPPLGTYAMLGIVAFGLGIALTAKEAIAIVATPAYAAAAAFVPWVTLGGIFQGAYQVVSIGTWFSMRTRGVALVTVISAMVNVVLNLVYVPRYGAMAAAVSTAIAYGVLALLHGALAHRLHPIAWEYRRWTVMFAVALLWYMGGVRLPLHGWLLGVVAKTGIVTLGFPISLLACRFFTAAELARARRFAARIARVRTE